MTEQNQPATQAITAGRGASGTLAGPGAVGVDRVGESRASSTLDGEQRARVPPSSTAATATPRCVRSRRRLPPSKARRTRSRSPRAWALSPAWCCRSARPATTSSPNGSLYAGTLAFLQGPCARFGIETTLVDGHVPGAFAAAVRPGKTMLVLAETPSNPRLDLVDLDELGALRGPVTIVDSTLATPLGQRPLDHGVHLCCTRPPRASPATTTPHSAWSPARRTTPTRSGRTRCCTEPHRRRTTR